MKTNWKSTAIGFFVAFLCLLVFDGYLAVKLRKANTQFAVLQDSLKQARLDPFGESDSTSWILLRRTKPYLGMKMVGDTVKIWPFPIDMDSTQTISMHHTRTYYEMIPSGIISERTYGKMFYQGGK